MLSRLSRPAAPAIDPTEHVLREIGQLLRDTRHARSEDVYDIAEYLRIRPAYLFALEQGDLSIMPGRPYAMGFLRTYGDYLELDGAELVQRLRRAKTAAAPGTELNYRTPEPESRRPTKLLIAASIVGAACIYGSWYLSYSGFMPIVETVASLPTQIVAGVVSLLEEEQPEPSATLQAAGNEPSERTVVAAAAPPAPSLDELRLSAPDASSRPSSDAAYAATPADAATPAGRSDGTSALAAENVPEDARQTPASDSAGALLATLEPSAGAAAAAAEPGRSFGATEDAGPVVLLARDSSWIQIRSASRDYIRTRTLEAGDRFVLPNRNDLALWTGNAGGLEVLVEGRSMGVLGAPGSVIRQIALTPQALRARTTVAQ